MLKIFMSDMYIFLLVPEAHTRWRGNLKGLSLEREWAKRAKISAPLDIGETYRLLPLSAQSISLDSLFKYSQWLSCCFLVIGHNLLPTHDYVLISHVVIMYPADLYPQTHMLMTRLPLSKMANVNSSM
jgi:hypothetical protein